MTLDEFLTLDRLPTAAELVQLTTQGRVLRLAIEKSITPLSLRDMVGLVQQD